MKYFLRISLAIALIWGATKVLFPHYYFHIEHFEYQLLKVSNWLVAPVAARILIGLLYVIAFFLLFYYKKIAWVKYLSVLCLSIPFILNPIYPSFFTVNTPTVSLPLPQDIQLTNKTTVLAFFSANCMYCKEGSKKLQAARQNSTEFPKVVVIGVSNKIEDFFKTTQTNFPYQLIEKDAFLQFTKGSYPKYCIVENQKVTQYLSPEEFNYRILHELSQKP